MKKRIATLMMILLLLAGSVFAQAPAEPQSIQDALAVVVIGDIYGFMNSAGSVTTTISPAWNGMWLRQMLGSQMNDPELEGIKPGSGLTILFWNNKTYSAYVEVDASKIDEYAAAALARGQKTQKSGGMLVNGSASDMVNMKFAPAVQSSFLAGTGNPTLKAFVNMPRVMQMLEPQLAQLQQSMELLQMQAQQQGMTDEQVKAQQLAQKILVGEMMGLVSFGKQLETMEFELKTEKNNIFFELAIGAKPGSNLGTFLSSPAPDPLALMSSVPNKGAVRMAAAYNADAMRKLVDAEMGPILAQMGLPEAEAQTVREYMDSSMKVYDGTFALDYLVPDKGLLSGSMVYNVKDQAAAMDMIRKSVDQSSGFMKMYEDAGMKMDLQLNENADNYKGTPIHKYVLNMDMQQMPGMNPMMQMMFGKDMSFDIALVDKILLYAMSDDEIEPLIDAAKAGAHPQAGPLGATELHGQGKQMYVDMNIGRLGTFAKNMVSQMQASMGGAQQQQNPMDRFLAVLQLVPPITMSGEWGQGNAGKMTLAIPVELVGKVYQIAMMQMMQGMAGPGGQQRGNTTGGPQPF